MDFVAKDNSYKSNHGIKLNNEINDILDTYLQEGLIKNYKKEPKYSCCKGGKKQFNPDFEIQLQSGQIVIVDNTTTVRSDRIKQKQWDALGVKTYFNSINEAVLYFVVIPDIEELMNLKNGQREVNLYQKEKSKILDKKYFSMIDNVLQKKELLNILKTNNISIIL